MKYETKKMKTIKTELLELRNKIKDLETSKFDLESTNRALIASEKRLVESENRYRMTFENVNDGIIIHGGERLSGTMMDPHNDHRLAMSLAVVGLRVPGIIIKDENCVDKSFPTFWRLWESL